MKSRLAFWLARRFVIHLPPSILGFAKWGVRFRGAARCHRVASLDSAGKCIFARRIRESSALWCRVVRRDLRSVVLSAGQTWHHGARNAGPFSLKTFGGRWPNWPMFASPEIEWMDAADDGESSAKGGRQNAAFSVSLARLAASSRSYVDFYPSLGLLSRRWQTQDEMQQIADRIFEAIQGHSRNVRWLNPCAKSGLRIAVYVAENMEERPPRQRPDAHPGAVIEWAEPWNVISPAQS